MVCQAPGFVEALLVGSGGGRLWLFLVVGVGDPGGLVLGRGAHADGAVGAHRVVPVDPFGGGGPGQRRCPPRGRAHRGGDGCG